MTGDDKTGADVTHGDKLPEEFTRQAADQQNQPPAQRTFLIMNLDNAKQDLERIIQEVCPPEAIKELKLHPYQGNKPLDIVQTAEKIKENVNASFNNMVVLQGKLNTRETLDVITNVETVARYLQKIGDNLGSYKATQQGELAAQKRKASGLNGPQLLLQELKGSHLLQLILDESAANAMYSSLGDDLKAKLDEVAAGVQHEMQHGVTTGEQKLSTALTATRERVDEMQEKIMSMASGALPGLVKPEEREKFISKVAEFVPPVPTEHDAFFKAIHDAATSADEGGFDHDDLRT